MLPLTLGYIACAHVHLLTLEKVFKESSRFCLSPRRSRIASVSGTGEHRVVRTASARAQYSGTALGKHMQVNGPLDVVPELNTVDLGIVQATNSSAGGTGGTAVHVYVAQGSAWLRRGREGAWSSGVGATREGLVVGCEGKLWDGDVGGGAIVLEL